jgi:hypothetical protein
LQLDAASYIHVSRALADSDFLGIMEATQMPEDARRKLVYDQWARTEAAYVKAVEALPWPEYTVSAEQQIDFADI